MNSSRLIELRRRAGLSQEELAQRAKITASMLGKVERGTNGVSFVVATSIARALADALGESVNIILTELADGVVARAVKPAAPATDPYPVYGPDELAQRLGISRRSLDYLRGQYPDYFVRVGRSWCATHNQLARLFADLEAGLVSLEGLKTSAQSGMTR